MENENVQAIKDMIGQHYSWGKLSSFLVGYSYPDAPNVIPLLLNVLTYENKLACITTGIGREALEESDDFVQGIITQIIQDGLESLTGGNQ